MAIASTRTLLPLDTFAKICGINPLHFNQVTVATLAPANTCDMPMVKYSWQDSDRIGREEVAQAIADAESVFAKYCGFQPAPKWIADERVGFPRPLWAELYSSNGYNIRGQRTSIRTQSGYVISGGIEAKSLIAAATAIVYSDANSDTYFETATISVATTVTDPNEIAIYYPGKSGADEYEIRPIIVSISGGIATITCRREQLVIEDLQESFNPSDVNGLTDGNFLTTVDVYRHYNDPSQQVQMLWEGCVCGGDGCAYCQHSTQYGCLLTRDFKLGYVIPHPASWDSSDLAWNTSEYSIMRAPDQVRLWYYAGYQDAKLTTPKITMSNDYARAITYLALSNLDRPLCGCRPLEAFVAHWKEDLAYNSATAQVSTSFNLSNKILDNPIGTSRGALNAWRFITKVRLFDAS